MEHYEIQKQSISDWLSTTINTLNAVVKFFSLVKLDTFVKSSDIACDVTF